MRPQVSRLVINNFRQFKRIDFDFTYPANHPKAGKPLEKICFIGRNGTGKTTLLTMISLYLGNRISTEFENFYLFNGTNPTKIYLKLTNDDEHWHLFSDESNIYKSKTSSYDDDSNFLDSLLRQPKDNLIYNPTFENIIFSDPANINPPYKITNEPILKKNDLNILIHSEAQTIEDINNHPNSNLNTALSLFNKTINIYNIYPRTFNDFWLYLIYLIKKRENAYAEYEELEENQDKTLKQVKLDFENEYPQILKEIAKVWDTILGKAGLYFDYENAKKPVQLTDNLIAYIKNKHNNHVINYDMLSSGIRDYIFKFGYLFALYFEREIDKGFLFLDEPENNLYPDFLYGIIKEYTDVAKNTQLFVSTHNPIIASQFEPCERFILDFDENSNVIYTRGSVPEGDDPNDILIYDFKVKNILGDRGNEMWYRFQELKRLISETQDPLMKQNYMIEFYKIGSDYKFLANDAFPR